VADAVTSVAVLDEEGIARRAVVRVDEAIDRAPGVQLLNGQINIRGSTGYAQGVNSRVLLLVDGVPANQGDRGGISWDLLPVDDIERVEIVKGAGSAQYGSAAMGGVVQLVTREIPT
jgi:iron complex outermembrane receptor protein